MADDDHFDRVRAGMVSGELSDVAFGALLPPLVRAKSTYHWTPLAVARRAALRFAEQSIERVLDVGCGPGKFCIAAALAQPEIDFCGVELEVSLTKTAQELATQLRLSNVEFRTGNALGAPWHDFDGFYFFNPFITSSLEPLGIGREVLRVAELLGAARRGATVVTYHGLGGLIPSSYELRSEEPISSGHLRVWVKTRARAADYYHLEYSRDVSRVPRSYVREKVGSFEPLGRTTSD
jgi:SAM-dependent methyltransferase